jgi:uncharacterized protein involved in cysteine biosynthesis
MIFNAFFKAVAQLGDPRFRRVLWMGIGLTLALLIAATAGFVAFLEWLTGDQVFLPFIGEVTWINDLVSWSSLILMLVLSVFLMVPVASAITSMFLDEVAQAVEDRYYPQLPPATPVPFWDAVRDTINFLGVLVAANIVAIALYFVFSPAALFIFWGLNGFLLGREYFTLAALRRLDREKAKALRARHGGKIWLAGTLMAMPLSIPVVNLLIPILGAATFTHIYHAIIASDPSARTSPDRAR